MDATQKLQLLFQLPDASCIHWDGDEMRGEGGFLSFRRRATVRIGDKELHVFVKISDSSRTELQNFTEISVKLSKHENLFYGTVAPVLNRCAQQCELDTVLPHVYHEMLENNGSVLVMEDLSSQGFCTAPSIMSLEQVRTALRSLAMLQAAFCISRHRLGQHKLADRLLGAKFPLLDSRIDVLYPFAAELQKASGEFLRLLPQLVDAERRKTIEAYTRADCVAKVTGCMQRLQQDDSSLCIAHWDLWYNNCMLRGSECRILDWQFTCAGRLGCDIGLLLVSSADSGFVATDFLQCVDFYYTTLKDTFESRTGAAFPVSQQQVRDNAVDSVNVAAGYAVLCIADASWLPEVRENSLRNLGNLLQLFRL